MALAIRQLASIKARAFELTPTPRTGHNHWHDNLELFYHWALVRFSTDKVVYDFQVAEKLDVHRIIADEWIAGLVHSCRAVQHSVRLGGELDNEIAAFQLLPSTKRMAVNINVDEVKSYDPWLHRNYDQILDAARYPDLYIDKYYDVFVNEYYPVYRKARIRPDGSTFVPLTMAEHPRYADNTTTKEYENKIPPEDWRYRIDTYASG